MELEHYKIYSVDELLEKKDNIIKCIGRPLFVLCTGGLSPCALPPQPKRLRRELFFAQNLEVSQKVAIFAGEMTVKRDKLKHNRSQLYRQNEELEEEKRRLEDAGKLLLWKSRLITNIGNLVFAGVVIGGVFEEVSEPFILFGGGVLIAVFCYFLGYNLYKRGIRLWRQ